MNLLNDLLQLFYPKICITCENPLFLNETLMCLNCRQDLPIICYKDFKKNNTSKIFLGRVPIFKAVSFLSFRKIGKTKKIIHSLKYNGRQDIGFFIGNWFGQILKDSNEFKNLDLIVPVPLHHKKLRKRGYNQLTTFGTSLSEKLQVPYLENILVRTSTRNTQTHKNRIDRYTNTEAIFSLNNEDSLIGMHILLIDDVITTGATLIACCNELLKVEGIKISIATIAITE